ncbi:MAG: aldo/keto reductase [Acidobacteria bacterium]|nr:aldo/keto reductase [Acidobacteriota bacterium]
MKISSERSPGSSTLQRQTLADLNLSKLMLGTAQFGLAYGIANRGGQPSFEAIKAILRYAYEHGVNCLDTAAGYGSSEEILGRALHELGLSGRINLVTKIKHLPDGLSCSQADAAVEESVLCSLKHLHLQALPVCLFHLEQNFSYAESLLKLREQGLVRHIGVSTVTTSAALTIISLGSAEAVQIPTSILDRRFVNSGVCSAAAKGGVVVFGRSIYLQGLILLTDQETPFHLRAVVPVRSTLSGIAEQAGMTLGELAMRYVLGVSELTSVLVGVDSVAQMKQNLEFFLRGPLSADVRTAVDRAVPELPEAIINPVFWTRARTSKA